METSDQRLCDCESRHAISRFRQATWYEDRRAELIDNLDKAMSAAHGIFDGPSIDYHEWAVEGRSEADGTGEVPEQYCRDIFGTLVSWGMHRMGPKGAKMPRYDVFRSSIREAWPSISDIWHLGPLSTETEWSSLCRAFHLVKATITNSRLVSNSKALAHLLPNSVGIIDRQYTLGFLGQKNIYSNSRDADDGCFEWCLFREIHEQFFYPLVRDPRVLECIARWPAAGAGQAAAMIETPLKAVDNLVIGYQKSAGKDFQPSSA